MPIIGIVNSENIVDKNIPSAASILLLSYRVARTAIYAAAGIDIAKTTTQNTKGSTGTHISAKNRTAGTPISLITVISSSLLFLIILLTLL